MYLLARIEHCIQGESWLVECITFALKEVTGFSKNRAAIKMGTEKAK
jgi:hypothetical protein